MGDGIFGQRGQIAFYLSYGLLHAADMFIGFETVILRDSLDLDLGQPNNIVLGHLPMQAWFERG